MFSFLSLQEMKRKEIALTFATLNRSHASQSRQNASLVQLQLHRIPPPSTPLHDREEGQAQAVTVDIATCELHPQLMQNFAHFEKCSP